MSDHKCKCGHARSDHSKDMAICTHVDPKKEDAHRSKEDNGKLYGWVMCPCNKFHREGSET